MWLTSNTFMAMLEYMYRQHVIYQTPPTLIEKSQKCCTTTSPRFNWQHRATGRAGRKCTAGFDDYGEICSIILEEYIVLRASLPCEALFGFISRRHSRSFPKPSVIGELSTNMPLKKTHNKEPKQFCTHKENRNRIKRWKKRRYHSQRWNMKTTKRQVTKMERRSPPLKERRQWSSQPWGRFSKIFGVLRSGTIAAFKCEELDDLNALDTTSFCRVYMELAHNK